MKPNGVNVFRFPGAVRKTFKQKEAVCVIRPALNDWQHYVFRPIYQERIVERIHYISLRLVCIYNLLVLYFATFKLDGVICVCSNVVNMKYKHETIKVHDVGFGISKEVKQKTIFARLFPCLFLSARCMMDRLCCADCQPCILPRRPTSIINICPINNQIDSLHSEKGRLSSG